MQVQRICQASGSFGDRNVALADLAWVIIEVDAGRRRNGRKRSALETQVDIHNVTVGSHLCRRRKLSMRQVRRRCLAAHERNAIGY